MEGSTTLATNEPFAASDNHLPADDASSSSSMMEMSFRNNNSFVVVDPIDLVWSNIAVEANGNVLLDSVSGTISEGLIAIMGPSGSGKTTLLNCLSCRLDDAVSVTKGDLRINGEGYSTSTLKKFLGYVMQDDVHNPLLTVRETLTFVAESRLSHKHTEEERAVMVEDALESLSLLHCADVLVGQGNNGIAGGEKKRLSVAIELLTKPKMLFLDEPTSSLDSLDALHFITSMKNLVRTTGCVVVCTIHQPQYKVFQLFDRLIMLRSGAIVYDGAISGVKKYCDECGRPCPANVNPADHMMEIIAPNFDDSFNTEARKRLHFEQLYGHREVDTERGMGRNAKYLREAAPFISRVRMTFKRSLVLLGRRQQEWVVNLIITLVNSVLVGTVFLQIGDGPASKAKRLPALFFAAVNQATFGAISTIQMLPSERASILRERASGNVSALSYFIAKAGAEILWKLPFPIIFSVMTYFIIGLQYEAQHFFRYFISVVMAFVTGMSVAMMVSAIARVGSVAALALPLVMEMCRLFGSYFAPLSQLPPGLRWINYISFIFYSFNAVAHNEMDDLLYSCAPTQPNCVRTLAYDDLMVRGQYLNYAGSIGILTLYFAICMTSTYIALRVFKS